MQHPRLEAHHLRTERPLAHSGCLDVAYGGSGCALDVLVRKNRTRGSQQLTATNQPATQRGMARRGRGAAATARRPRVLLPTRPWSMAGRPTVRAGSSRRPPRPMLLCVRGDTRAPPRRAAQTQQASMSEAHRTQRAWSRCSGSCSRVLLPTGTVVWTAACPRSQPALLCVLRVLSASRIEPAVQPAPRVEATMTATRNLRPAVITG